MTTTNPTLRPTDPTSRRRADAADPVASTRHEDRIRRVVEARSFATLATTSPAGHPHVAGVVYEAVDGDLWVHTLRHSRKGRNLAADPRAAVCIPFRRLPAGPPFTIQFQATAELVDMDAPEARALLEAGRLKGISGHGAIDEPDGVFVRIRPARRIHTYGLGVNPIDLIRDPLHAGARSVDLADPGAP